MPKLDDLPLEIVLEILSYNTISHNRNPTPIHPLNALASANRHLYTFVEEYTRGLLKQHANFTPPRFSKTFSCRKKWLAEYCQFCKRKSTRRACFYISVTCCRICDKQFYPKITMTLASKTHHLSKLDLFTPNALHPSLPPLTSGLLPVMGSTATMILEVDVLKRKAHIRHLLGPKNHTGGDEDMYRRPAAHDRIVTHLGLYFCPARGGWRKVPPASPAAMDKAVKSMRSEEGRREYVRKALGREWAAMGMGTGRTGEEAVELDG